ncbi:MAG TPA: hypothetical protein VIH78_08515 [Terriglobales bacterium]
MLSQMWGGYRWTARCLLLVMLVPAFGPMAMAQAGGMHGLRAVASAQTAPTEMPCHHAMAHSQLMPSKSSAASLQATDDGNCCANHCCCGAFASEWAQPASGLLCFLALVIEPALLAQGATLRSSNIVGLDSARAPPRS